MGIGLASHLGLFLNIPTVGCAKTKLVGEYHDVPDERFVQSDLIYNDKKIGIVFRTTQGFKLVFVSPGHLIDLKRSVDVIKCSLTKYRLPEMTRQAHLLVNQIRQSYF